MSLRRDAFTGLLLGTAVGDAIGLPREGLSARRAERMFGPPPLGHRLLFGRGMISDDTEHACMTAQAWLESGGDPDRFARVFARKLRWWLAAIPAGVGLATLRSGIKLWSGVAPSHSGVWSAGNGPVMRSPVLGLLAHDDADHLVRLVRASTMMTHTHPLALDGAVATALAARHAATYGPSGDVAMLLAEWDAHIQSTEMRTSLTAAARSALDHVSPREYAGSIGCGDGVSGYILKTAPAAIFCWLRFRESLRDAVEAVVSLGGDSDSTGALTGALAGADLGDSAIPPQWLDGLVDWPRSSKWIRSLADRLHQASERKWISEPLPLNWAALPIRNLVFTAVVLSHGVRRLLPPY
ncbi:MAG: ADP-ribosylglycohydrolase family protein [Phycisphaerales bacterium]